MPHPDGMTGGERLMAVLASINAKLSASSGMPTVQVGFLPGSAYPDGTSIPMVAATQEWGATIQRQPGTTTIYRKVNTDGTGFLRKGKFVRRSQSNFASDHAHGAYTITIPPRPFFRNMIHANAPTWGADMAKLLKADDYDSGKVLAQMGDTIKGQLQQSIHDTNSPANAPSTVRAKGFAKPLIGGANDSGGGGLMWNSVDYIVST